MKKTQMPNLPHPRAKSHRTTPLSSRRRRARKTIRKILLILSNILLLLCALAMASCREKARSERILFDFESDGELDRVHWKCHALMSLSEAHAAHGAKSLKLELYPSEYPGFAPMVENRDWHAYKALCFEIYNPRETESRLTLRVDDRDDYPDYDDRYNESFVLTPGWNRMRIPLETLRTSGTDRPLDLRRIYRFLLFMAAPRERQVLYLDYIRLDGGQR